MPTNDPWDTAESSSRTTLHFLHIGKTGGSAIRDALRRGGTDTYQVKLHNHEVALRDIPHGELIVFFVRDPILRFVSGFYSRQRQGRPRYNAPWGPGEAAAFERFHTASQLGEALDPDHPDHATATKAMGQILHVNRHYTYWLGHPEDLRLRASDLLFIGFQETLDTDFAYLARILNLSSDARLPTDEVRAHRNPWSVDRSLTEEAEHNLQSWYAADYQLVEVCRELRSACDGK